MQKSKKILLIDSAKHGLARMEGTLRVAGYDVLLRNKKDDITSICLCHDKMTARIDLLIIEGSSLSSVGIWQSLNEKIVDAVLYVDIRPSIVKPYHTEGNQGWLYQPSALLAVVKELIQNTSLETSIEIESCQ